VQQRGGDPAQGHQHRTHAELHPERGQRRRKRTEWFGEQPAKQRQRDMNRRHAPPHPTQCTRQLNVQAQRVAQRFPAGRYFGRAHHRLDFGQGA